MQTVCVWAGDVVCASARLRQGATHASVGRHVPLTRRHVLYAAARSHGVSCSQCVCVCGVCWNWRREAVRVAEGGHLLEPVEDGVLDEGRGDDRGPLAGDGVDPVDDLGRVGGPRARADPALRDDLRLPRLLHGPRPLVREALLEFGPRDFGRRDLRGPQGVVGVSRRKQRIRGAALARRRGTSDARRGSGGVESP